MTNEKIIRRLVDRFLIWELPKSVKPDPCVGNIDYPYTCVGTNLLTAEEAKQMFEHVLSGFDVCPGGQ